MGTKTVQEYRPFSILRTTVKGFTYKIVEFAGTILFSWFVTGSLEEGLEIGIVTDFAVPYAWFILHEWAYERKSLHAKTKIER